VQVALLRFGERALRHFIYLERPEGMDLDDDVVLIESDLIYEAYYDARNISRLGPLIGNRRVRLGMRSVVFMQGDAAALAADVSRAMTTGTVTATNQHGEVVAVANAQGIMLREEDITEYVAWTERVKPRA
jgi:hypothetical protein